MNQWERIASRCLPECTTKGGYMRLAKAIEAMRANGIVDRFSSTAEMARFLTDVLGWEVKYKMLNTAFYRLNGKTNEWEKSDNYIKLLNEIANEKQRLNNEEITNSTIESKIQYYEKQGLSEIEILAEFGKLYLKEHHVTILNSNELTF